MTILLALAAFAILLILFSIVGVRVEIHKFDDPNNPAARNGARDPANLLKNFGFPAIVVDPRRVKLMKDINLYANSPVAQKGVMAIAEIEPAFDLTHFMQGARAAYEMIVGAFSKGDKLALQPLLDNDLFQQFSAAIDQRAAPLSTSIEQIEKSEVLQAGVRERNAFITVRFVVAIAAGGQSAMNDNAEKSNVLTNASARVTDIWTFLRPLGSADPNWRLIETKEGELA